MADTVGTWLGIALALAGFAITFWQARVAAREARRAREAAGRVEAQLASNSALLLLPEMLALEVTIMEAASDPELLRPLLTRWRHLAGEAAGILDQQEPDLAGLLGQSAAAALGAEGELQRGRSARTAVGGFLPHAGAATREAARFLGRARAYTSREESR